MAFIKLLNVKMSTLVGFLIFISMINTPYRGDKVQDKSGFPDCALMHFGHEIIVIIALIWF